MKSNKQTAIILGLLASLFFAVTFVVNRFMSLNGGSWIWSSSLRFYWMLPFFLVIVLCRGNFKGMISEMNKNKVKWLIWSTVGFGVFYAPLTFAASYGPSWLVASTWQFTIIAGLLLSPFTSSNSKNKNQSLLSSFAFSGIVLIGILIMQIRHAQSISLSDTLLGVVPVLIASIAYPLGNRKTMQLTEGKLDVYQRILGMLIGSLPFWLILGGYELFINQKPPENSQYLQTLIIAVCSGVIATSLFFFATDKVSDNESSLAAVEATQSAEVLFALAGEILLLNTNALPDIYTIIGILLIITGMILHSLIGEK